MQKNLISIVFVFIFLASASAQSKLNKRTETIMLGETSVKVNIYEKKGSPLTFIALHHNEQTSIITAKEQIEKNGGRLIELEALNDEGKPARRLKFDFNGKSYSFDPNRIFTDNGRTCHNEADVVPEIKLFADKLLKFVFPSNGNKLRKGEKFLVSLHNNSDIDRENRTQEEKERDLTAFAFIKGEKPQHLLRGAFEEQAEGVYISNVEEDEDNFIFLSMPTYLSFFAGKGFHVVLQKPAAKLNDKSCEVDDGSLSVYFGQRNLEYINVEADNDTGFMRQRQMIEAIYQLLRITEKF